MPDPIPAPPGTPSHPQDPIGPRRGSTSCVLLQQVIGNPPRFVPPVERNLDFGQLMPAQSILRIFRNDSLEFLFSGIGPPCSRIEFAQGSATRGILGVHDLNLLEDFVGICEPTRTKVKTGQGEQWLRPVAGLLGGLLQNLFSVFLISLGFQQLRKRQRS